MNSQEIEMIEVAERYDLEEDPAPQDLAYTILWMGGLLLMACMIAAGL
jgi:hypothetical protein